LKDFFGPYFRTDQNDKWHWKVYCPDFPVISNPQTRLSSVLPDNGELCPTCKAFEITDLNIKKNKSIKSKELKRIEPVINFTF
jgi:hypothetical protein